TRLESERRLKPSGGSNPSATAARGAVATPAEVSMRMRVRGVAQVQRHRLGLVRDNVDKVVTVRIPVGMLGYLSVACRNSGNHEGAIGVRGGRFCTVDDNMRP